MVFGALLKSQQNLESSNTIDQLCLCIATLNFYETNCSKPYIIDCSELIVIGLTIALIEVHNLFDLFAGIGVLHWGFHEAAHSYPVSYETTVDHVMIKIPNQ